MNIQMSFLLAGIIVFINYAKGQNPNLLPPTPEVAAFGKNVDIPIGYSSGTPQINIPIYTLENGSISLPVSLSYNAAGIRVEETPTWVGLGWNLSAGDMIARTVRALPDDKLYGYLLLPTNRTVRYIDSTSCKCLFPVDEEEWDILEEMVEGHLDTEPDIFTFSAGGYSGKFYYCQDSTKFVMSPYQNIKIETPGGLTDIQSFRLTLPNGIIYEYGGDTSNTERLLSSITYSSIDGQAHQSTSNPNAPYTTSWSVSRIEDPNGRSINFDYESISSEEAGRGGETSSLIELITTPQGHSRSFQRQYFNKPVLKQISGQFADVYFKRSSSNRLDAYSGNKSLDTIVVKSKQGQEVKSFFLNYEYTTAASETMYIIGISDFAEMARKRLVLKSIKEKGGTVESPPYEFTYSSVPLPTRLSTSQDYWGFYNGKANGNFLMPKIFIPQITGLPEDYYNFSEADRRIDSNYNQAGLLKKIKYPTGGSVEYFYESNTVPLTYFNTMLAGMELPDMQDRHFAFGTTSLPMELDPPYSHYLTNYFSVAGPLTKAKVTLQLPSPCGPVNDLSCLFKIVIKSLPDSVVKYTILNTSTFYADLPSGNYQIEAFVQGSTNDPVPNFSVNLKWGEQPNPYNFKTGGLRVKRIVLSDSLSNRIFKSFTYNDGPTSSGSIAGCPVNIVYEPGFFGSPSTHLEYYVANSAVPLTNNGQLVNYQFVTEYYDSSNTSFKTEYTLSSDLNSMLQFGHSIFAEPLPLREWRNGHLLRKKVYEKVAMGDYRVLSDEQNFYTAFESVERFDGYYTKRFVPYDIVTEWYVLDSSDVQIYSYPGDSQKILSTSTKYYYNERYLPTLTQSKSSKGQIIHTKTKYPFNYNNISGFEIPALLSKNILDIPIKQETSIDGKIVSAVVIKYNTNGNPVETYSFENITPVDTVAQSPGTLLTTDYRLKTSVHYNGPGDPVQFNSPGNKVSSFLWNVNYEKPIAHVENADTSSLAYTSFEEGGGSQWSVSGALNNSFSVTGEGSYNLSGGAITKSGLSTQGYIVSYWKRDETGSVSVNGISAMTGNTVAGWTYFEHRIVNPVSGLITVSGSAIIDELRLYPENARMTTYTYKPLIGVTSICSPNNDIAHYEYDGMGRLSLVRDQSRNIVKKICYNFAGQVINCDNGAFPDWRIINSVCENSSGVNTGNLVVYEKDMNPASSTFNQTRSNIISGAGTCPVCETEACTGNDRKCINNICETGVRINTGSVRLTSTTWRCYFHYKWSDNSTSPTYDEVISSPCGLTLE